jgi:O-antigen ligase
MTAATCPSSPLPWSPQRNTAVAAIMDDNSPFQRFGFNVLLLFLFLVFSRIFDVKFGSLHITGASYRVAFAMVLLSRGFITAINTNIGKALLGFTFCCGMSVPFSVWKGGSMAVFKDAWLLFSFVTFLAVGGLISSYAQYLKAAKTLAVALLTFTVVANIFGSSEGGRLMLAQGKYANPNEMAQALLIGLPLWGAIMVNSRSLPGKVFSFFVMLLMLATTVRTGSRGALIGFAVMFLVIFLRASFMGKVQIILVTVVFGAILASTMPGKLIARYKTITDEEAVDVEGSGGMIDSAQGSTESRKTLLKHSLLFTLRHPIFGVGAGMFSVADDAYSHATGVRSQWLGTHNSYTQVSSELGVPGALFFIAAIVMSLRGPYDIYKKTRGDPRLSAMGNTALGLHYCVIIYAVTILFDHIAYSDMLPVLGGMAAVLVRTAEVEIERIKATPLPVTMSTATFHTYLGVRAKSGQAV